MIGSRSFGELPLIPRVVNQSPLSEWLLSIPCSEMVTNCICCKSITHTLIGPLEQLGQFAGWPFCSQMPTCETMQSLQLEVVGKAIMHHMLCSETYNWCMHLGMTMGVSISLKQMGQSALSSPVSPAMNFSAKKLGPEAFPSPTRRSIRSVNSNWLSLEGDNARSSSLVSNRFGWRTARRSLTMTCGSGGWDGSLVLTSWAWPIYVCNFYLQVLSLPVVRSCVSPKYKWNRIFFFPTAKSQAPPPRSGHNFSQKRLLNETRCYLFRGQIHYPFAIIV